MIALPLTVEFKFHVWDLARQPLFHALALAEDGRKKRIGAIIPVYADSTATEPSGWSFICGDPHLGIAAHLGQWPTRPTRDDAAADLIAFIEHCVKWQHERRVETADAAT